MKTTGSILLLLLAMIACSSSGPAHGTTADPSYVATGGPPGTGCQSTYDDGAHTYTAQCDDDAGVCACTVDGADAGTCRNLLGCIVDGQTPTTCCQGLLTPPKK